MWNDLGTDRLPWGRLGALLRQTPLNSALYRSIHGESALWGPAEHLLASVIDVVSVGNWQRANAGLGRGKRPSPFPKPWPRPTSKTAPPDPRRTRRSPKQMAQRIRDLRAVEKHHTEEVTDDGN